MTEKNKNMFASPNKDPQKLALDQEKDLVLEDFPIRTMKKDLENAKDPKYLASFNMDQSTPAVTGVIEREAKMREQALSEKQKTSPFVTSEKRENDLPPVNLPMHDEKIDSTVNPIVISSNKSSSPWIKAVVSLIVAFVILAAAVGGYYFWTTNWQNEESSPAPVSIVTPNQPEPVASSLSPSKPNYLSIDTTSADSAKIKSTISDYVQKVSDLDAGVPVEFIITDSGNNPLSFSQFSKLYGISFSSDVMNNLGDKFSLFIYKDTNGAHLGLAIDSKDPSGVNLKSALYKTENDLQKNLAPLFIKSDYAMSNKPFSTSYYNGAEVRYLNIIAPGELSIDYTIFRNKLLIGTSEMTLRALIDGYIKSDSSSK